MTAVERVYNATTQVFDESVPLQYFQDDKDKIVKDINDLVKERTKSQQEILFFDYSPDDETYRFDLYKKKEFIVLKKDVHNPEVEKLAREFFIEIFDGLQDTLQDMTIIDGVFHRVLTGSDRVHWGVYNRTFTPSEPPFDERCIHPKLPHKIIDYAERGLGCMIFLPFMENIFYGLQAKHPLN